MNHWRKQIVPFRFAEKLWPRPPAPVHPLAPGGYHCFITRRCLSALLSNRRCRQHPQLLFCTNGNCEYSVSIHLLHSIHPSFVSSSVLGRELLFRRRASWCFCLCGGGGNGGEARRTEQNTFYFWSVFRRTRAISLRPPAATSMPFAHARARPRPSFRRIAISAAVIAL